jgi:hypothetical protein
MIVISDRIKIGRMGEHDIFRLKDYKIVPFSHNYLALSEAQVAIISGRLAVRISM